MAIQLNFKCNESWEMMPKMDAGSFCDKCAKNVHDLTDKSDVEIQQLYQQNNGKLCGRIRVSQLNGASYKKARYALAKFCVALYMVFGGWLFKTPLVAQTTTPVEKNMMVGKIALMNTIKGKVVDKETQEPLLGVAVYFKNNNETIGALTDENGNYIISFHKGALQKDMIDLEFSYVGYRAVKVQNIILKLEDTVLDVLKMDMEEMILMGDVDWSHDPIIERDPEKQGETIIDAKEIRRSPY